MLDDLSTAFGQLDTLFYILRTLDNNYNLHVVYV